LDYFFGECLLNIFEQLYGRLVFNINKDKDFVLYKVTDSNTS